jgi:hypothetical protein
MLQFLLIVLLACNPLIGLSRTPLSKKQNDCRDKLLEQMQQVLAKDNELIRAQLTISALKLTRKVMQRKNLKTHSLEAYTQDIMGQKTQDRLGQDMLAQQEILNLYDQYRQPVKYADATKIISDLKQLENMSDADASQFMIVMQKTWQEKDDFGFDQKDFAIGWFVNTAKKNATGKDSFFISNMVRTLLAQLNEQKDDIDKLIAKNYKAAHDKLKAELQKLKTEVFAKYKSSCLDLYHADSNPNSQNTSVFESFTCDINESKLLDQVFIDSIEKLLSDVEPLSYEPTQIKLQSVQNDSPSIIRKKQDWINQRPTDKERIVQFYKQGLSRNQCSGFIVVDKKTQTTSLFLNDGSEIVTTPSISGLGIMNADAEGKSRQFNPDSVLRKWSTGNNESSYRYSRTTGAGIFYVDKSLDTNERKKRKYDQEFNDRVMVLYSVRADGSKREEIQAIHGVPNTGWINNRRARMQSFEQEASKRNISTGCVNLEGYNYDLMNEYLEHECPIYILPEDESNYFYASNGELVFSTGNKTRKDREENAVFVKSNGETIIDKDNINDYNFSPLNRKFTLNKFSPHENTTLSSLFKDREELIRRARQMTEDDFQDYAAITYALSKNPQEAKQIFLDLYTTDFRFKQKASPVELANYEKANLETKRRTLIENYKKEFQKQFETNDIITLSREVSFDY